MAGGKADIFLLARPIPSLRSPVSAVCGGVTACRAHSVKSPPASYWSGGRHASNSNSAFARSVLLHHSIPWCQVSGAILADRAEAALPDIADARIQVMLNQQHAAN